MSGFLDWNLALDTKGGPNVNLPTDAAVIVNASSGEFYKNPIFYNLAHFSKFIPPGSRRVDVQSNQNTTAKSSQTFSQHMFTNVGADWPAPVLPQRVFCVATVNPDNSSTVIVLNA